MGKGERGTEGQVDRGRCGQQDTDTWEDEDGEMGRG